MSKLHRNMPGLTRRQAMALGAGAALASAFPIASALAADKVIFRTNWLFYGSHGIFFLGIDKGYYGQDNLDVVVKQGDGSGSAVRLVANKDSTFAYCSAVTMMKLAAQGAPVISVATIDATGTDAVIVNPDSGIKTFKDLEGKKVLTTAGRRRQHPVPGRLQERRRRYRQDPADQRRRQRAGAELSPGSGARPSLAASTTSRRRSRPMAARRPSPSTTRTTASINRAMPLSPIATRSRTTRTS